MFSKKIVIVFLLIFVAGCAQQPVQENNNGQISEADAVQLIIENYPEYASVAYCPEDEIGCSSDIIAERKEGYWDITFYSGSGDCQSGCINKFYVYFKVTDTKVVELVKTEGNDGTSTIE